MIQQILTVHVMNPFIYAKYLKEKYACDIRLLRTPVMPVSSSEIRQMIRGGETEDLPIPKKVADYIDLNRLYQVSELDGNNT